MHRGYKEEQKWYGPYELLRRFVLIMFVVYMPGVSVSLCRSAVCVGGGVGGGWVHMWVGVDGCVCCVVCEWACLCVFACWWDKHKYITLSKLHYTQMHTHTHTHTCMHTHTHTSTSPAGVPHLCSVPALPSAHLCSPLPVLVAEHLGDDHVLHPPNHVAVPLSGHHPRCSGTIWGE